MIKFQSTPPVWVVTLTMQDEIEKLKISIHTTRVGGDPSKTQYLNWDIEFQSTPPVWVVTEFFTSNI